MKTLTLASTLVLLPLSAMAHDVMAVKDAYARSANPMTGGVFMLLDNHREVDCTLSGVSSDAAERVELHSNEDVDGVMSMREIEEGILIPAGETHALERGGDHVMLMGLKAPMEDGATVALTLDFGDCGTVDVEVPVDNQREPQQAADGDAAVPDGHAGH
ncbi:copper chaperone PCu(A)C (plasmid) [Paracoccus sp. TK19116]|uniref:Copper chaperone PCu(A)C n=1 Tax=Paracoccus albicereus TaxID=2922394 RepID=A0ABT1MLJ7_9RHOB|nr:copper chaperone PCu(A)C [Paracoccus albicereus]MCQ0969056.1 copper chaperone PCu(A)C [Paracoccus albicereus]